MARSEETVDAAHEPERYSRPVTTSGGSRGGRSLLDNFTANRRRQHGQWSVESTIGLDPDCVTIADRVDRPTPVAEPSRRQRQAQLVELLRVPIWWEQANCLGMDPAAFHAGPSQQAKVAAAREVCQGCDMQAACLDRALEIRALLGADSDHGVWGGTTPHERTRIIAARRRSAA